MTTIDAKRRAEIRERCANATKAPWSVVGQPWGDSTCVYTGTGDPHGQLLLCDTSEREWNSTDQNAVADAHFIAHARQDVPDLLAALEAAEKRIAELEAALRSISDLEPDDEYLGLDSSNGNYDDCYRDGWNDGERKAAIMARAALGCAS